MIFSNHVNNKYQLKLKSFLCLIWYQNKILYTSLSQVVYIEIILFLFRYQNKNFGYSGMKIWIFSTLESNFFFGRRRHQNLSYFTAAWHIKLGDWCKNKTKNLLPVCFCFVFSTFSFASCWLSWRLLFVPGQFNGHG